MRNNRLKHKILVSLSSKPSIIKEKLKPLTIEGNFNNPKHDFFYDFAKTLEELGLAKIIQKDFYPYMINGQWVWPGDRLNHKWVKKLGSAFCCNTIPPNNPNFKPLIYFPKKYKELLNMKDGHKHDKINILWCGSNYKSKRRDNFSLVKYCDYAWTAGWTGTKKTYKQKPMLPFDEYIKLIGSAKYCLCLPGFGKKCHKEMETMAVGTVPIFTPGCCTSYHNKLLKGVHYFYAENKHDIEKIKITPHHKWEIMSSNCYEWFNNNIAPEGAYNTIKRALQSIRL